MEIKTLYRKLKAFAAEDHLEQMDRVIDYAQEMHAGQYRNNKLSQKAQESLSGHKRKERPSFKRELNIHRRTLSLKRDFSIYDEMHNKKYTAKTDLITLGKRSVRLYNMAQQEMGRVIEKRHPLGTGWRETYYELYLNQRKVGNITEKPAIKMNLSVDYNGWKLKGAAIWSSDYEICDANDQRIIYVKTDFGEHSIGYSMQYDDPRVEIIGLLLIMTVDISHVQTAKRIRGADDF